MRFEETLRNGIESVILLWRTWSIRGFVLISLLTELLLLFAAPLRKKTSRWFVVGGIWLAYQLADAFVTHALSTMKSATSKGRNQNEEGRDLRILWAVCMLLHFGGPDTITALSMEDNKLWRRSYLRFGVQLVFTAMIGLAVKPKQLVLQHPYILGCSLLILFAGVMKSVERILCMRSASPRFFGSFLARRKPNPGPDHAVIVERQDLGTEELNDAQLTQKAYHFYNKFKGMYVNRAFCCHDRVEVRDDFLRLSWQAAFTVVETEMKFAFEAFYTNTQLFSDGWWVTVRFLSSSFKMVALFLWLHTMHLFQSVDAFVTTCLLAGAVLIDIIAVLRLYLSDWKIAQSAAANTVCCQSRIALPIRSFFLYVRRRRWGDCPQQTPLFRKVLRFFFRQWSESIPQFNFIDYCSYQRPTWRNELYMFLGAKDTMDGRRHVTDKWFTNTLRQFIFEQLQRKSFIAGAHGTWEHVNSSRGSWILSHNARDDGLDPATFEPYIADAEYDESLLMWHIATELFYETGGMPRDTQEQEHREFSKILSDYMLYLSVRQPKLMARVAPMAQVILEASCAEARRWFGTPMPLAHEEACRRIMRDDTSSNTEVAEEDNSVLFDASELAKRLKSVRKSPWKFVSQIWVELLCYAAPRTPGIVHAMLLRQGGQLVTLVRLLMLHFGLSNQFRKPKNINSMSAAIRKHS